MSAPVTPRNFSSSVLLENLSIQFKPTWDGANWVIDINTIELRAQGNLAVDDLKVVQSIIPFLGVDLNPAGEAALLALYDSIETQMAAVYG